jgi:hypothetical protein
MHVLLYWWEQFGNHKLRLCSSTQTQTFVLKTRFITYSFVFSNTNSKSLFDGPMLPTKVFGLHKHKHKGMFKNRIVYLIKYQNPPDAPDRILLVHRQERSQTA